MDGAMALAIGALASSALLLTMLVVTRGRLQHVEQQLSTLEREMHGELAVNIAVAQADARAAAETAREAARAAGVSDPPLPELAFELLTGRLVRAVAFGAGARRAIARLGRRELRKAS